MRQALPTVLARFFSFASALVVDGASRRHLRNGPGHPGMTALPGHRGVTALGITGVTGLRGHRGVARSAAAQ